MTNHNAPERPRSRTKTTSGFLFGVLFAFVLIGIGGFLYWRYFAPQGAEPLHPTIGSSQTTVTPRPLTGPQGDSGQHAGQAPGGVTLPATGEFSSGPEATTGSATPDKNGGAGSSPTATDPQQLVKDLNTFYAHLDQEAYMRDFGLKEPSRVHFSRLLQKLVDNPPVVIRETDDILTLLKNTAHFYRILNQENITILKGILHQERKSFEQILKSFYALTYHPELLQKEYGLTLPLDALHDYAAFFLNTIGGRLYLFRRDSLSRMTISYYAILVIDRANQEGSNPQGIDLRPAINSLIEEIENSGKSLKFRDEYLDKLYDLQEKYN